MKLELARDGAQSSPKACHSTILPDLFALSEVGALAIAANPAITAEERNDVMTATGAAATAGTRLRSQ